jgi:hypothetical protein
MPVVRYIVWVGTSLLALLFVANWFLPEPLPEPAHEAIDRPIIRIASLQQAPEGVVIDTNQPTIVPPPTPFGNAIPAWPSALQSFASVDPPAMVVDLAKKRPKAVKRGEAKVASYQPPPSNTPGIARGGSATAAPPTKLSFVDIISGQLARSWFNLH